MAVPKLIVRTALIAVTATLALSACGGDNTDDTEDVAASTPATTTTSAPAPPTTEPETAETAEPAEPAEETEAADGGGGVLSGTRQVVIVPVPSFESVLALDAKGRLGLTDGESDRSLFVFTPNGRRFQIKTAKADPDSGEPSCLSIKVNGSAPLTVVAVACDASSADQQFDVNAKGKAYSIGSQSAFLQVVRGEVIAEEQGDAPLRTTFELADNGKAGLPALD